MAIVLTKPALQATAPCLSGHPYPHRRPQGSCPRKGRVLPRAAIHRCGSPSPGALWRMGCQKNTAFCIITLFHPLLLTHFWHKLMLTASALIYNMLIFPPPSFEPPFRGVKAAAGRTLGEHSSLRAPRELASDRAAPHLWRWPWLQHISQQFDEGFRGPSLKPARQWKKSQWLNELSGRHFILQL